MTGPAFLIGLALGALSVLLLLAALGGDAIARAHDDEQEDVPFSPDTEAAITQALTVAHQPATALAVVHQLRQREQGR